MRSSKIIGFIAPFALIASYASAESADECNVSAKLVRSERAVQGSPNWKFTFQVTTSCEASSGSFEYEYRVKGSAGNGSPKRVSAWNAANGRDFKWTDEVNVGTADEAEFVKMLPATFRSKKIK